jgi:hypothetical protein
VGRKRELVLYGLEVNSMSVIAFPKRITGLEWRHRASNGYTWRLALPEDLPRIRELWAAQEAKIGPQDRPDLFEMPVVLTLVAENEHGEVVEALYGEVTIEWTSVGIERAALRTVAELFPYLRKFCGDRTLRLARVNVPRRIAGMMRKFLPSLKQIDEEVAQFVFRIRD